MDAQGVNASLGSRSAADGSLSMMPLASPAPQLAPPHLPPCVGAHSGETGLIMDKHQRNAVLGHTLGLIEAQLDFLRHVVIGIWAATLSYSM